MIEDINRTLRATADKLYVRQTGILKSLRDMLLPRLISGQLRLSVAKAIEEAAA